jgi:hypothetical protein
MNRVTLILSIILLCASRSYTQPLNENSLSGLRSLITELNLPNANNVLQLCSWNDSLASFKFQWRAKYDSLMQDSTMVVQREKEIVRIDAALTQCYLNPSIQNYALAKAQFLASKDLMDEESLYVKELHAIIRELAVDNFDYTLAYSIQNKLHSYEYADWLKMDKDRELATDSLKSLIKELEGKAREELVLSKKQTMQWHIIAVIAIGVAVILFVLFVVFRFRWKRRALQLTAQVNDKSEEEALVQKLEQAKREISELRIISKKKIESTVTETPVSLTAASAVTSSEIAELNNQIQQALAKIKSHCEAGKSSMGVPTYMSIVNDTSRLGTFVQHKSEEWVALMNSKKDTK